MSWSRLGASLVYALALSVLSACGFQPVYSGDRGTETVAEFSTIKIDPIRERVGQLLRNQLLDSLNAQGEPSQIRYHLIVEVAETKQELAIRKSELATRSNLNLTASYRLLDVNNRTYVLTRVSRVSASYNLLTNEFGTLSAEADARERGVRDVSEDITRQLALYFRGLNKAAQR